VISKPAFAIGRGIGEDIGERQCLGRAKGDGGAAFGGEGPDRRFTIGLGEPDLTGAQPAQRGEVDAVGLGQAFAGAERLDAGHPVGGAQIDLVDRGGGAAIGGGQDRDVERFALRNRGSDGAAEITDRWRVRAGFVVVGGGIELDQIGGMDKKWLPTKLIAHKDIVAAVAIDIARRGHDGPQLDTIPSIRRSSRICCPGRSGRARPGWCEARRCRRADWFRSDRRRKAHRSDRCS
jgi:hypothetical protein